MKKFTPFLLTLLIGILLRASAVAQSYPVQTTVQLTPPYSLYLADYAAPGSNRIMANVLLRDLSRQDLQTRLRLTIEGVGISITTRPDFRAQPLYLQGGLPLMLDAVDLAPYFDPQNLVFQGVSRQEVQKGGTLPEGLYRICIQVLDYNLGAEVSNQACGTAWLILNDPPIVNLPRQGEKLRAQDPQNILFQWTPRHTGSPNSAFNTEYDFQLVELWPDNRDPNHAILSTPPIFETTTFSTSLVYGPAETPLEPGRRYAFRVRARAMTGIEGMDLFKNDGYSEVHSFTYGDACTAPMMVAATALSSSRIEVRWDSQPFHTEFIVRYRKKSGKPTVWQEKRTYLNDLVVDGLLPQTEYEFQVLGICGSLNGVPSETVSMATSEAPLVSFTCGSGPGAFDLENQAPLEELNWGDVFRAGDVEVTALEVKGGNGIFSGTGLAEMPWLRNVKLRVEFSGIFLNTDHQLLRGSVKSVFNPDSKMIVNLDGMDDLFKGNRESEQGEDEGAIDPGKGIIFEGTIDSVYVDEKGEIVIIDTEGERTVYAQPVDPVTGEKQAVNIVDGEGNGYVVDGGGKVTLASENKGNVDGMRIGQPDQREELIAEILQYLQHTIIAWQDDNATALPECMPANNDLLNPVLVQINNYEEKPSELLSKFSKIDQSILSDHISTYNKAENPVRYQDILIESDWQTITCRTYSYLNDLTQGIGGVEDASADKGKLESFISDYRAAYKQGSLNFTFSSANFRDVYPTDYYIKGVSSIQLGLVDKRENNDYEPSLSLGYVSEDVTGQKEIAGTNFEGSTVFQFGKPNWNFMDGPKFLLYGYHSEPAKGLDSKTLLKDYLPGKYDYEAVQRFINKVIDSHDKGEESLNMKGELGGQQVYARNVDFGDKGIYDLYVSRTGDLKKDDNSFYSYSKTEITTVFGFAGSFTQYRIVNTSGGTTSITLPTSQAEKFETSVLKLHSVSSGTAHIDLVNAIRAANLNANNKLDITGYGVKGGLSPVFEINHDGKKLKLMVLYPSGVNKNKIDPSRRPTPSIGQEDNAMGKAGTWVIYEFPNEKGKGTGHNIKIYVMEAQIDLFESYLLIAQEVLITGINWRNQSHVYFKGKPCYNSSMGNACCMQASLTIIEQFGVTTDRSQRTNIAEFISPETDYVSLRSTSNFESQIEYLNSTIKPNNQGGKPVLVGVHYKRDKKPYNESNPATYHFIVIVGKGYDRSARKYYYRFYDVGEPDDSKAMNENNKLFIEEDQRMLRGQFGGKLYTVTEIRKNY